MPTVNKRTATELILRQGRDLDGGRRCVKVVAYTSQWGGEAYGLIFEGQDLMTYHPSIFVRNPHTLWEYKPTPKA